MEDVKTKKCHHCHEEKDIVNFNKCKTGMMGLHNHCRECQKIIKRNWDIKNKEILKNQRKTEEYKKRARNWNKNKYYSDPLWREKTLEKNKIRRRSEKAKEKCRIQRKSWMEVPTNRIANNLRSRIRQVIKGKIKSESTQKLLGCSFDELKTHLECQFYNDMTWNNYGKLWHIDHIIPCDFFNFENEYHQRLCFNFRNLQPLLAEENISKGNKINIDNFQTKLNELKRNIS